MKYLAFLWNLALAKLRFLILSRKADSYEDVWDNEKYFYRFELKNGLALCSWGKL